jgi:hypothetical protein
MLIAYVLIQVKHRVHPNFAGQINLPPATGLFANPEDSHQPVSMRTPEAAEATDSLDGKEEAGGEAEAVWSVGVVATSQLLNYISAAR